MKNRKISIRLVFPVVMSASIAVCIISCMLLFSDHFSTYFQKDAIEKTGKQKNALAQSLEKEIDNMNDLTNSIYYQEIKEYDVSGRLFSEEMQQRINRETDTIYAAALYDANGRDLWHSENLENMQKEEIRETTWFRQAKENIETINYGQKKLLLNGESCYITKSAAM